LIYECKGGSFFLGNSVWFQAAELEDQPAPKRRLSSAVVKVSHENLILLNLAELVGF